MNESGWLVEVCFSFKTTWCVFGQHHIQLQRTNLSQVPGTSRYNFSQPLSKRLSFSDIHPAFLCKLNLHPWRSICTGVKVAHGPCTECLPRKGVRAEIRAHVLGPGRVCLEVEAPFACSYALTSTNAFVSFSQRSCVDWLWVSHRLYESLQVVCFFFFLFQNLGQELKKMDTCHLVITTCCAAHSGKYSWKNISNRY